MASAMRPCRSSDNAARTNLSGVSSEDSIRRLLGPLAARAVELVDGFEGCRDELSLLEGQFRPPNVEDQHDARLSARIPRLVLDAVVEQHNLPFAPLPNLIAHAQT